MTPDRPGPQEALLAALAFDIPGRPIHATPLGRGHINDTFLLVSASNHGETRHVLQRINRHVFPDPSKVMENIERVTAHLTRKLAEEEVRDPLRRALSLVPARDGRSFVRDQDGWVWRVFNEIQSARSWDTARSPAHVREASRLFALFSRRMQDLPGPPLHETIPQFHDTCLRFRSFIETVERDPMNRASAARSEIEGLSRRDGFCLSLVNAVARNRIENRVAHNDTKLSNVLMDKTTREGLLVIDLDTVMPGLFLTDFGDFARSAANPVREAERQERAVIDETLFEAAVRGALDGMGNSLSKPERRLFVTATAVLAFELGLRFLTDYLSGDHYFKVTRPGQNLDRARVQIALLSSIEEKRERLERIVTHAAERGAGSPGDPKP